MQAARELKGYQLDNPYNYIQTDVGIFHGSSGGPLMDMQGRVIGVCTMALDQGRSRDNFAPEWKAVADLMAKADPAKPLAEGDLAQLSQQQAQQRKRLAREQIATTLPRLTKTSKPASPEEIAIRARELVEATYCRGCNGTGQTVETRNQTNTQTIYHNRQGTAP